jgi:Leucine-rich repeat (LRR) protein
MDTIEEVQDKVDFFTDKFSEFYGLGHLVLAMHAAFPISVTVDLLYQVWANFKNYTDSRGRNQTIPMLAISDLLLSPLLRQTGADMYEMSPNTRSYLLEQLKSDPQFGEARIQELASFLNQYIKQLPDRPEWKNYKEAQKWTALLASDPALAARNILQSLVQEVSNSQVNTSIGIANMIETLSKDSEGFVKQLQESVKPAAPGAQAEADKPKPKRVVITDGSVPGREVLTFNLPPHISSRLKGTLREVAQPDYIKAPKGTVYGLFIGISDYEGEWDLQSAHKDAMDFARCLRDQGLIEEQHSTLLLDKAATAAAMYDSVTNLLSEAGPDDFVVIYFSGHADNKANNNRLLLHDYQFRPDRPGSHSAGSVTDHDFRTWIDTYAKKDPHIILVLDTHAGSPNWLNENNPKHVSIMASHYHQMVTEISAGGHFTTALIKVISERQGHITYRQLYKGVLETFVEMDLDVLAQTPLFITNNAWDKYIFKHAMLNQLDEALHLLNEAGYPIAPPELRVESALAQFLSEHKITDGEKTLFYLEVKKRIKRKGHASVMFISSETQFSISSGNENVRLAYHEMNDLFEEGARSQTNPGFQANMANQGAVVHPHTAEYKNELPLHDSIIFTLPKNLQFDAQLSQRVHLILDIALALDMPVVLIPEVTHVPEDLQRKYRPILWENMPGNLDTGMELIISKLSEFINFLDGFVTIRSGKQKDVMDGISEGELETAEQTKRFDLSNRGLDRIPPIVFKLTQLEELYLEGNNIKEIPADIANLKNLRLLNLNGNAITNLPQQLLELDKLLILSLSNTDLNELPANIDKLASLFELHVHGTKLSVIPDALANLEHLKVFDARENNILNIPRKMLSGSNAFEKFRKYVKSFPVNHKPDVSILLLANNSEDIHPLESRLLNLVDKQFIEAVPGIDSLAALYRVLRSGLPDQCLVYIKDGNNHIFDEFATGSEEDTRHKILQYIRASNVRFLNIFYDSNLPSEKFAGILAGTPGINSVIAYEGPYVTTKFDIPFLLLKNWLREESVTKALEAAKAEVSELGSSFPYKLHSLTLLDPKNAVPFLPGAKQIPKQQPDSLHGRIAAARRFKTLNLAGLGLTSIPDEVFTIRSLQHLIISSNDITEIPPRIGKLKNLVEFDCSNNPISVLPAEIYNLQNLEKLDIHSTDIEYISGEVILLQRLAVIDFSDTSIRTVPGGLSRIKTLRSFRASNVIINVPAEVLEDVSGKRLRSYFSRPARKDAFPSIILASSARVSPLTEAFDELVPRKRTPSNFHYRSIINVEHLEDLSVVIKENLSRHTLLIIDDEKSVLTDQFGWGNSKYFAIRQYFNSFFYPLNVIYNGPLESADVCADMILNAEVNTFAVSNESYVAQMQMPALLIELMLKSGLSLLESLRFIEEYFTAPKSHFTEGNSNHTGYDLYYNRQKINDFRLADKKESDKIPALDVVRSSIYSRDIGELESEAETPQQQAPASRVKAIKKTVAKTVKGTIKATAKAVKKTIAPPAKKQVKKAAAPKKAAGAKKAAAKKAAAPKKATAPKKTAPKKAASAAKKSASKSASSKRARWPKGRSARKK